MSRGRRSSVIGFGLLALVALASYLGWRAIAPPEEEAPSRASAPPAAGPPPAERPAAVPAATAPSPAPVPDTEPGYPSDPAALVRALAPLQREVEAALAPVAARCPLGGGVLDLSLETGPREVLILEARLRVAPVEAPAGEHDVDSTTPRELTEGEAVRCVKEHIEGTTLSVPSARIGRAWRTFYRPLPGPG